MLQEVLSLKNFEDFLGAAQVIRHRCPEVRHKDAKPPGNHRVFSPDAAEEARRLPLRVGAASIASS
jgi:hypothetical protein